jgi:hypothetical protein
MKLPEHFIPRSSIVMFHVDIPNVVEQTCGEAHREIIEEFTADANDLADVDIEAGERAAIERLRDDRRVHQRKKSSLA